MVRVEGEPNRGRLVLRVLLALFASFSVLVVVPSLAASAPSGRGGDPVVLKGSQVQSMLGTRPGRVVAFAWKGQWRQVPVQVDERKMVDVRNLYPDPAPDYAFGPGFPLEVYADAKTRTGADTNRLLDSNDEIAFMARDTGARVGSGSRKAPTGTSGPSAQISVTDPIDGGRSWLYLFVSTGKRVPSAGRSYVDFDFRLLELPAGKSIRDGYRYANSNNPEDTSVRTRYYSVHSTDRWMDDEIRLRSGGSTGADILDREVAQATLRSCGRTELTFSGNWNRGNDTDEGTFVAVKEGPIRAIRDYMGANSGPYTQRQHIYYEEREDNTIFLRVHPMLDLYAWTDFSADSVGMTYRNLRNTDGVTVDGTPDDLTPITTEDIIGGKWVWDQLSGPQGSVSTIYGVDTDIPNPSFGNYYLDDANLPLNGNRTQCNGDGVSYGASGFGILGPVTPNTDPRLADPAIPVNLLTVKRVRYFGGPTADATTATGRTERVSRPLQALASGFKSKKPPRKTTKKKSRR